LWSGSSPGVITQESKLQDLHRITALLHFRGHFTGTFGGRAGQGQAVDFIAVDIYRVQNGLIAENWHLEDNLTLMQQLGVVAF
jgi:predicted ester cyclase